MLPTLVWGLVIEHNGPGQSATTVRGEPELYRNVLNVCLDDSSRSCRALPFGDRALFPTFRTCSDFKEIYARYQQITNSPIDGNANSRVRILLHPILHPANSSSIT